MAWTAYYQVVRDRILDDNELIAVAKLVRAEQAKRWDGENFWISVASAPRPSNVIAKGGQKLGRSSSSSDLDMLTDALAKLRALLPDAVVNASDDMDVLGGTLVPDEDPDGWTSVLSVVPPPPPVHPAILKNALAMLASGPLDDKTRTDAEVIRKLFTALGKNEVDTAPLDALAAACDPDTVAHLGLSTYARLSSNARAVVSTALENVRDAAALTDAFLHAWTTPYGNSYYNDMRIPPTFVRAMGVQPRVCERWIADLDGASGDRERRRADRAMRMLGESATPAALAALAAFVRRCRDASVENERYLPALRTLALAASPAWTATTLLAIDGRGMLGVGGTEAVQNALAGDLALGLRVIRAALVHRVGIVAAMEAIQRAGIAARSLEDVVTPYLEHTHKSRRLATRKALAAMRGEPFVETPDEVPFVAESLLADPDRFVRQTALLEMTRRTDPSLYVALMQAQHIDTVLCKAIGWSTTPDLWESWTIIPETIRRSRWSDRLAWAMGQGASTLGPQRELPTAPLADLSPDEICARVGVPIIRFDDELRAALLVRENESFSLPTLLSAVH